MYFRRQHLSVSTGVKREPLKTLHKEINTERKFRKQKKTATYFKSVTVTFMAPCTLSTFELNYTQNLFVKHTKFITSKY